MKKSVNHSLPMTNSLQKQKKQAEKEALDPDANYTEDKGDFEIPTEDEPEEPGEEDTEPI